MIPATFPHLAKLHAEAVALIRNAGTDPTGLARETGLDEVRREVYREQYALATAQLVAYRVGCDRVFEILRPAMLALDALEKALLEELASRRATEAAHG